MVNIEHGSLKTDDSLSIFEVPSQYSTKFVVILTNQSHFKLKIISIILFLLKIFVFAFASSVVRSTNVPNATVVGRIESDYKDVGLNPAE